jgi:hypothetical protein
MPMTENEADLSPVDRDSLRLAIDLTLADDPPDPGRAEQVQDFLNERPWLNVATFCAYSQQMARLQLHPGQTPPCWLTEAEADAILAEGPYPASDGSSEDISNCAPARLLKAMLELGISAFHPHPLRAIEQAKKRNGMPQR